MEGIMMKEPLAAYLAYLEKAERSPSTRRQYQRDILCFLKALGGAPCTREAVLQYKQRLTEAYQPATVNTKLAALNGFFAFLGRNDLGMRLLKIQRKAYCRPEQELTKAEYLRLIRTARRLGKEKLALLAETLGSTGIRVSELPFITAEAVRQGEAVVRLKGKTRMVLIPGKLRKALKHFMEKERLMSGPLFVTENGKPLDRSNIWRMLKRLCKAAEVDPRKVFPHNFRHLFARCFYAVNKDLAKLADLLGHSSINTTRIYIISSGREHQRQIDALGLVV